MPTFLLAEKGKHGSRKGLVREIGVQLQVCEVLDAC